MKLRITDPLQIVVDRDVASVRAEDASGSFGILPGHADFLTALDISVVSWRDAVGTPGYCAVRNGILRVSGGDSVAIATREAHAGDDLDQLEAVVLAGYRRHVETERSERAAAAKLRMQAIRRMVAALDGRLPEVGA
ncbi:F0F1 ATP synthase subunit epsilon [Hephaestia mangrovi]|uniref:F0F1 ATP synthase subunit epsilon n=1 Tax=Hephaestia mangrovi TaxID=2873268 RepID=UPI001CA5F72B|nr:F0F1 ATP synthase subunit epsilon [Hephaestia mangrovi]MBY8826540.1 F0F1 ATP synthase subunit epsilon [Hephaestia mangrovi]